LVLLIARRPSVSPLFPYATLFRSRRRRGARLEQRHLAVVVPGGVGAGGAGVGAVDRERPDGILHAPSLREQPALGEPRDAVPARSEEHTSELQSRENLVCRLLLEK